MREGWKEVKLADYYTISSGLSKSADQFGSGFPFVSFKNVFWNFFLPEELTELVNTTEKDRSTCSVKEGDVFLTRTSEKIEELGMSSVALKDYPNATFNGFTKRLRPKNGKDIDPRYIGFYLRTPQFRAEITAYSSLTTRASLNNDIIGRLRILLPTLTIQRKIASILSAYDGLIENNLKRIKFLEEKAQLTYEEWFVKMRFPGYETAVFDEGTGLPKGWEKKEFQYFGKIITGKTPSTKNELFFDGKIPFVKTPDMAGFPYVLDCSQQLSELGGNSQQNKFIPKNSLMISCIGSAGAFALASEDCQTNQQINSIIFYQEYYTFYFYCLAKGLKPILEGLGSNGATMTNVNKGKFEKIEAIFPELQLLKYYHDIVKNNFEIILSLQKQNRLLKEARDILLPRLMSGMIDVDELQMETLKTT